MSCGCENKQLGQEIERIRRLAKAFAKSEGCTVGIILKQDKTYGIVPVNGVNPDEIVEFITPY